LGKEECLVVTETDTCPLVDARIGKDVWDITDWPCCATCICTIALGCALCTTLSGCAALLLQNA
jgi:hypothetical protein